MDDLKNLIDLGYPLLILIPNQRAINKVIDNLAYPEIFRYGNQIFTKTLFQSEILS